MRCISFPWYNRIVPLTYDDSLSYYEQMLKLYKKTQEIGEVVNDLPENILKETKTYVDSKVGGLVKEANAYTNQQISIVVEQLTDKIDTEVGYVAGDLTEFKDETREKVVDVIKHLTNLQSDMLRIGETIKLVDKRLQKRVEDLYHELIIYINEHISKVAKIYLYSPYDGKFKDSQEVVNEIFDTSRYGAITCKQFNKMHLTAGEWDDMKISCKKFISNVHDMVIEKLMLYVRDGFTGLKGKHDAVINSLTDFDRFEPIEAEDYDGIGLMASSYDMEEITAYDYDFHGIPEITGLPYNRYDSMSDFVRSFNELYKDITEIKDAMSRAGTGVLVCSDNGFLVT